MLSISTHSSYMSNKKYSVLACMKFNIAICVRMHVHTYVATAIITK